jgi:hypothetical protein
VLRPKQVEPAKYNSALRAALNFHSILQAILSAIILTLGILARLLAAITSRLQAACPTESGH